MPRTSALVSMHLAWLSISLPAMLFATTTFSLFKRRELWLTLAAILLLLAAVWIGIDAAQFTSIKGNTYSSNRLFFALIMSTDVPLVALTVSSTIAFIVSCFLPRPSRDAPEETLSVGAETSTQ